MASEGQSRKGIPHGPAQSKEIDSTTPDHEAIHYMQLLFLLFVFPVFFFIPSARDMFRPSLSKGPVAGRGTVKGINLDPSGDD